MEFRLLGPLEVRADDGPLPLGGAKQRALLALLLVNANRVVARDRLVDGLWGDEPPQTAVESVQVYVSRLRKLLPPGMLETQPPGYRLAVEPDAVDLLRFERLVAAARDAEPKRARALLGDALELWRGAPLGGLADEPFAGAESRRLEELRLAALEDRIEADLALGRHTEVVAELEALTEEQPGRERLRVQLMLALYRSGRQAEALTAYRSAYAALREVGLEPGATLRTLERQILAQDDALDIPRRQRLVDRPVVLPGPLVPASPFPFVGRSAELAALRALAERAGTGEGGVVLLTGEAGAGKTRLVRELAHELADRGVLVLYGSSDAAVGVPYEPARAWLEFLLRSCEPGALQKLLDGREVLGRLVPELGRTEAEPDPYVLQQAVTELVVDVADRQPLLLVADDIHWAGGETLQLLQRLARRAAETRLLLVAVLRDPGEEIGYELGHTLGELARLDSVTRLSLRGLGDDDVSAFVKTTAHADATPELVAALGSLTDGTPLLLCELWRHLREEGGIEVSNSAAHLVRPLADLRGSERLRDVVRQRLARMEPETRRVLELAAVAGPLFELHVVGDAAGLDESAVRTCAAESARAGIVEELPTPAGACRFTHELVRRAVYDRTTGTHRAELHRAIGEALERAHADAPDVVIQELAHHFTLAARVAGPARGVDYNIRAARAAVVATAYDEARARYTAALDLGIADPQERARVQLDLASMLHGGGHIAEARQLFAASVETAMGSNERGVVARARVMSTGSPMGDPLVDHAQHRAAAEEAVASFERQGDLRNVASSGRLLALALRREGRLEAACAAAERALAAAEAVGDREVCRQLTGTLAYALCDGPTHVAEAVSRCEALLRDARDDPARTALVARCLSLLHAMAGRVDDALEQLQASSGVLDELRRSDITVYRAVAAETMELLGDRAGAERELVEKWTWFREIGDYDPDARAMHAAYHLALLYCDDGRWDDAADCLDYGAEIPVPDDFHHEAVLRLAASARLAAHRGELVEAAALARRGVALADQSDFLNLRARARLALAEVEDADAANAAALALYDRKGNSAAAGRVRAASLR